MNVGRGKDEEVFNIPHHGSFPPYRSMMATLSSGIVPMYCPLINHADSLSADDSLRSRGNASALGTR